MPKGKKSWYNYSKVVWPQQKHSPFFMCHMFCSVLVGASIAGKRLHDHDKSYKKNI